MEDGNALVTISPSRRGMEQDEELKDWYFAYGSDMSLEQIRSRCSRPVVVGAARLADYRLQFCGDAETGHEAMETVEPAPGSEVWGVLFSFSPMDWERLDLSYGARLDGAGMYFHFPVMVTDMEGKTHPARIYKKDIRGVFQDPSREHLECIVRGASENSLPSTYIEALTRRSTAHRSYHVSAPASFNPGAIAGISCAECSIAAV